MYNQNDSKSNFHNYLPMHFDELKNLSLCQLPVGLEITPFNHIEKSDLVLNAKHIGIIRLSENKFAIGSTEYREYLIFEGGECYEKYCSEVISNYLDLISG